MQLSWYQMDEENRQDTSCGIVTLLCPRHIVSAELTRATRHRGHVPALVSEMRGDLGRTIGSRVNSVVVRSHEACFLDTRLDTCLPRLEA